MDFSDMFPAQQPVHLCDCRSFVHVTLAISIFMYFVIDCLLSPKSLINKLQTENATLKNIITKSVDRAFVKMMKNGNESDNENEN